MSALVTAIYPEHKWEVWQFTFLPQAWWHSGENQALWLKALGNRLKFSSLEDYYNLTYDQIVNQGGTIVSALLRAQSFDPLESRRYWFTAGQQPLH